MQAARKNMKYTEEILNQPLFTSLMGKKHLNTIFY